MNDFGGSMNFGMPSFNDFNFDAVVNVGEALGKTDFWSWTIK